jgi:hypothetical protein
MPTECTCKQESRISKMEARQDNFDKTLDKLVWGTFGTLTTAILTLLAIILGGK